MVELDHQRSAAKTLVNKMGLDTFVLFNLFNYCRFASFSEFAFHCFNSYFLNKKLMRYFTSYSKKVILLRNSRYL